MDTSVVDVSTVGQLIVALLVIVCTREAAKYHVESQTLHNSINVIL